MALFELGKVTVSAGAAAAIAGAGGDLDALLRRYRAGDWGEADPVRRGRKDLAARSGRAVHSIYTLPDGTSVLIITGADRSATGVLLPSEYRPVELSARDGYALWAKSYNLEANPLIAVEEPQVDRLLAGLAFRTVLDAGTGTGRHALRLARRGAVVTALDQSPEMMRVGRAAARREGLDIRFLLASLDGALPFGAARFDLVICALVLCHMPDLRAVMREFQRVARPGGHLLVTDFHPDAVAYGWRTTCWDGYTTCHLPNFPNTRADYIVATEAAGFELLTVLDVPLREVPAGYETDDFISEHGNVNFGLVLLARKRPSG